MQTIGITGGSGFVGQQLTSFLVNKGYDVIIFTRTVSKKPLKIPHVSYAHWDHDTGECDINALREVNAVVHLAGAGVDKIWTEKRKKRIMESRVKGTNFLVSQLKQYAPQCKTLISASAIGYYGPDKSGSPFTESSSPNDDFLAEVCKEWESSAEKAQDKVRTVILRFGVVLGKEGGAMPQLSRPMILGFMPIMGSGEQMVSWIEISDLTNLILFAIEHDHVSGTYNAVSPQPVTHKQLMKTIARKKGGIKIPLPVPSVVLKMLLGEMSGEILKSCTVSGKKIEEAGYRYLHPDINTAVSAILQKN